MKKKYIKKLLNNLINIVNIFNKNNNYFFNIGDWGLGIGVW